MLLHSFESYENIINIFKLNAWNVLRVWVWSWKIMKIILFNILRHNNVCGKSLHICIICWMAYTSTNLMTPMVESFVNPMSNIPSICISNKHVSRWQISGIIFGKKFSLFIGKMYGFPNKQKIYTNLPCNITNLDFAKNMKLYSITVNLCFMANGITVYMWNENSR